MSKTSLLLLILACLQTPGSAQPQSTALAQTREVQGQILTSIYLPSIRVKFEDNFKHIGSHKFVLFQKTQAEQFFFVDVDNERRIKRMYWVQFENYLPNVDATYDDPVTKTLTIDGQTYLVNPVSIPPNLPEVIMVPPESVSAHAVTFLLSKGYRLGTHLGIQRLVRLVDDARRNEFIIVYIEDTEIFPSPDKKDFWDRGLKGFTVLKE